MHIKIRKLCTYENFKHHTKTSNFSIHITHKNLRNVYNTPHFILYFLFLINFLCI